MELIDKEKVVAEIEKLVSPIYPTLAETLAYEDAIEDCKDILDSIKTKEVDFENEWKEYFKYRGDVATVNIKKLAKYFFELGLKTKEE